MTARDELLDEYGRADTAPLGSLTDLRQKLAAVRVEVLREVLAAIQNPEQRRAVGGGLGWETARDVVYRLIRMAEDGA